MDAEKSESSGVGGSEKTLSQGDAEKTMPQGDAQKTMSQGAAEALKECLEENKGDDSKCKSKVEALKSSSPRRKPLTPLRLRSGSLTDV